MASLKQNIKSLLTDVEKFLAETLKSVKLDKSSKDGKEKLLERVRQLLEEMFGGSNSNSTLDSERYASGGSFNQASGGGSSTSGESSSNLQAADDSSGYSDEISKIAVNDLKDVFQAGLLDRKKKSGLKSWEQMYCVVSRNILYMYKKQNDAKQKEAFCLTGYEFQEAPGLEKDSSKKEMCFELTKAGSLAFQFRAGSKDAMLIWKEAIQKGIQASPDIQITGDDEDGETYDDVGVDGAAANFPPPPAPIADEIETEDPDDIYEECGNLDQPEPPKPAPPKPVSAPPKAVPPKPESAQGTFDELYDDGFSAISPEEVKEAQKAVGGPPPLPPGGPPPPPPQSLPPGRVGGPGRREPPPLPTTELPPLPPPKSDLPPIPVGAPPPPVPERSERPPPPVPANPPPLPDRNARVPQLRTPFMDRDEDFENLYYGKWDCQKDSPKELSFKRGDIVHVLSKDFDGDNWWVGELEGHVGLVPKDFMCPAFALVA